MKSGAVVKIRIPPADVMTCIDLCQKTGLVRPGMSLAECIRIALSGLCLGARNAGLVPQHDGFDYDAMVSPFTKYPQAKKLAVSQLAEQDMVKRDVMDYAPRGEQIARATFDPVSAANSHNRKRIRLEELSFKRRADPSNFSPQEQAELDRLFDEVHV